MTEVRDNLICFLSCVFPCTLTPSSYTSPFLLSVLLPQQKRFLRCSPFDEYRLWKTQVDNGSKKGGERLNILTQSLLLRRTKDQLDSTGKPLVILLLRGMGRPGKEGDNSLPRGPPRPPCSCEEAPGWPPRSAVCWSILYFRKWGNCCPGFDCTSSVTAGEFPLEHSVNLCNFIPAALFFFSPRWCCPSVSISCII